MRTQAKVYPSKPWREIAFGRQFNENAIGFAE